MSSRPSDASERFIAPQAQFEESANDRGSRRCPLVGMLRESGGLIRDPLLRASSSDYNVSSVWKRDPAEREIDSNLCVCLVSVFYQRDFLVGPIRL